MRATERFYLWVGAAPFLVFGCGPECLNERAEEGEECDDGNTIEGDGCDSNCSLSACGNDVQAPDEECDDGNILNDDLCTAACTVARCGDGIVQGPLAEECDDGNQDNNDDCTTLCRFPLCGDGFAQSGEVCDDGNLINGDGCDNNCTETGCGNGVATAQEACLSPAVSLPAGDATVAAAVADIDEDGDLDLAAANLFGHSVTLYQNQGDGTFTVLSTISFEADGIISQPPQSATPFAVIFADAFGGSAPDLFVIDSTNSQLRFFENDGAGGFFTSPQYGDHASGGAGATSVAAGDLNRDGFLDVVITDQADDAMIIYMSGPIGPLGALQLVPAGDGPFSVALSDIEGDQDLDIIYTTRFGNTVEIFFSSTLPHDTYFSADQLVSIPVSTEPVSLAAKDLDGDGKVDLAVACLVGDVAEVLFFDEGRQFSHVQIDATLTERGVLLEDLDQGGLPDLIVTGANADQLFVHFNLGGRSFSPGQGSSVGDLPVIPVSGDLNGDGFLDIITPNFNSDDLSILIAAP